MDLWVRLKERKLVQWALAYLAGAWVLLQVADVLADALAWLERPARARALDPELKLMQVCESLHTDPRWPACCGA